MSKHFDLKKSILLLMTGSGLSQLIIIAAMPILTRVYEPDGFGVLGVFTSCVMVLSLVSSFRYDMAIMLPKTKSDAIGLAVVSMIIGVAFVTVMTTVLLLLDYLGLLNKEYFDFYVLIALPIVVMCMSFAQVIRLYINRMGEFKKLAKSKVLNSVATSLSRIAFGFYGMGAGLVIGTVVGQLLLIIYLFRFVIDDFLEVRANLTKDYFYRLIKEYSSFPIYDLPSVILYSGYSHLVIVFLGMNFDPSLIGVYFFALTLIKLPALIVSKSFGEVFYKYISSEVDEGKLGDTVNKCALRFFLYALVPFLIISYGSYYYSAYFFGDQWGELYKYIWIVSVPLFIEMVSSPYVHVLKVIRRQHVSLVLHGVKFLLILLALSSFFYLDYAFIEFLILLSLIGCFMSVLNVAVIDALVGNNPALGFFVRTAFCLCFVYVNYVVLI